MEIGSEFWISDNEKVENHFWDELGVDNVFLFSGRTAIEYVLKQIMRTKKIKTAYFPSYCCASMLQPFFEKNIQVEFYQVFYDNENGLTYKIDVDKKYDIFFAMSYFGYDNTNMDYYIEKYRKLENTIIVEDITHRLLSKKTMCEFSNYAIASLRKWFPIISGGIAINLNEKFSNTIMLREPKCDNILIKKEAMLEKKDYIEGKNVNKENFLKKYAKFNKSFSNDYEDMLIDQESLQCLYYLNIADIRKKRKRNANIIRKELESTEKIYFLIKSGEEDCPLFVPILLEDEKTKNTLQEYLIKNEIYLPSHWDKPDIVPENLSNIYGRELSLVCDQRYSVEDIKNYIKIMKQFLRRRI